MYEDIEYDTEQQENTNWFRHFRVYGDTRTFMYLYGAPTKAELQPFIQMVKGQGDLYRITKWKGGYEIWDARS